MVNPRNIPDYSVSGVDLVDAIGENASKANWIEIVEISADTLISDASFVEMYYIDASSNTVLVTLPSMATSTGKRLRFKAKDVTNTITIDGLNLETIEGSQTQTLTVVGQVLDIVGGPQEWLILNP